MTISIPNLDTYALSDIVCDYNGTIAKDGKVLPGVKTLFQALQQHFTIHVITADTFGSVQKELEDYNVKIKVISSSDHTQEKADFIEALGKEKCVAIGNGNNDTLMLKAAAIGIAVIGDEGCCTQTLLASDIAVKTVEDALSLLSNTKRLIATLRR